MPDKNKIKIVLMATVADYGGAEKVVIDQLKTLKENESYEPVLMAFSRIQKVEKFYDELNDLKIKVHNIVLNKHRLKYINPLVNFYTSLQIIKKEKPDLIHSHGYRANMIAYAISRMERLPIVTTCHGYIFNGRKIEIYNKIDQFIIRRFDKIIAVSSAMKKYLLTRGVKEKKICVIKNAAAAPLQHTEKKRERLIIRQKHGISPNSFVGGYIGRISSEKGLIYLIESLAFIKKQKESMILIVIGDGDERKNCEALTLDKGLCNEIKFIGFQKNVNQYLSAMDCLIMPSLTEGTPMIALEAMSMRVPIIASNVGGIPEMIRSHKTGILVEAKDTVGIAKALLELKKNSRLRKRIAENAFAMVTKEYSMAEWRKNMVKFYRGIKA